MFPKVFVASKNGFPLVDTLFESGCGGWVEGLRF
jgi:hypothetical protein